MLARKPFGTHLPYLLEERGGKKKEGEKKRDMVRKETSALPKKPYRPMNFAIPESSSPIFREKKKRKGKKEREEEKGQKKSKSIFPPSQAAE